MYFVILFFIFLLFQFVYHIDFLLTYKNSLTVIIFGGFFLDFFSGSRIFGITPLVLFLIFGIHYLINHYIPLRNFPGFIFYLFVANLIYFFAIFRVIFSFQILYNLFLGILIYLIYLKWFSGFKNLDG